MMLESADAIEEMQPETWSEADEALDGQLAPGEVVLMSVGALIRTSLQFFDRCEVVLTDRQVILLKPSWPWGYRYDSGHLRTDCKVKKYKQRVDGSQLLVVDAGEGQDLCFYVPRRSRDGGVAILEALK